MNKWLKADYRFNRRAAIFFFGRNERELIDNFYMVADKDPRNLEVMLRERLLKERPELSGCVMYWFGYNAACGQWELAVSHASLDEVPDGCQLKRRPVDPVYERELGELTA